MRVKQAIMTAAVASLLLLLPTIGCHASPNKQRSDNVEMVGDEKLQLDDKQLGSIVRDFGESLKDTMEGEMDRLISEIESKDSKKLLHNGNNKVSEEELERLRKANKAASEDIKARIELAGDNNGALPQLGLGSMASSFAAAAGQRLQAAGSYIANKMRALSNTVKSKIPNKLRRFFKWPTFLKFKIKYHKQYKSLREELYRQMVFLKTHVVVGMQHIRFLLKRDKHLLGPNQFADWTEKDYYERLGNHLAETEPSQLGPELDAKTTLKLQEMARSGKNIFGLPVVVGKKEIRQKRSTKRGSNSAEEEEETISENGQFKRQRRTRRDADDSELNAEEDELNASEDEDEEELGNDLELMDIDNSSDESAFNAIDEFASDIDLSGLENIEGSVDAALGPDFEPIDLRDNGCFIRAEQQENCGNCYSIVMNVIASYFDCMERKSRSLERSQSLESFKSSESSEGSENPESSKSFGSLVSPERYHPRFVSDCGRYMAPEGRIPGLNGCSGGRITKAYIFMKTVGVMRFPSYNIACYESNVLKTDTCAYPKPDDWVNHGWKAAIEPVNMFRKTSFSQIKIEEIDLHLRTMGPVVFNARTWKNFAEYGGGIVNTTDESETSTLHSMLIVGHDKDATGRPYWIVMNSHGISWGENGFFRIYHETLEHFSNLYAGFAPLT